MAEETREKTNFIWEAIKADIAEGKNGGRVQTRFPPEPNGYLHIGHVKALSVDFLTAERFGGVCNLRFDDTNPTKEKEEFVEAIKDDIHWLGFNYANVYYASEQYDQIYEFALRPHPPRAGVCGRSFQRGDPRLSRHADRAGQKLPLPRPHAGRKHGSVSAHEERRVPGRLSRAAREDRHGFPEHQSARPHHLPHQVIARTIARATSGASIRCTTSRTRSATRMEGVTHSLCSLEYEIHRPLYDWVVNVCNFKDQAAPD